MKIFSFSLQASFFVRYIHVHYHHDVIIWYSPSMHHIRAWVIVGGEVSITFCNGWWMILLLFAFFCCYFQPKSKFMASTLVASPLWHHPLSYQVAYLLSEIDCKQFSASDGECKWIVLYDLMICCGIEIEHSYETETIWLWLHWDNNENALGAIKDFSRWWFFSLF